MNIKIGIVHADKSYMDNFSEFLSHSDGVKIIFSAINASLLEQHMHSQAPDVSIVSQDQCHESITTVISKVCRFWSGVKILAVGSRTETGLVRKIIETGGHGYASEGTDFSKILDGCRQLCEGEIYFDPATKKLLLKEIIYGEQS